MASTMTVEERIKLIIESTEMSREKFALKVGIPYTRISNIFSGRAKVRHEEIEAIGNTFPQFMTWLAYEVIALETAQIDPMSIIQNREEKLSCERLKRQRQANLESFRKDGQTDEYEEKELELLIENKLSFQQIQDEIRIRRWKDKKDSLPLLPGESD